MVRAAKASHTLQSWLDPIGIVTLFWAVMNTYVGKDLLTEISNSAKMPIRVAMLSVLLCGVVIWAIYQSALTSELAVRVARMPFTDLNEFLSSDYQ